MVRSEESQLDTSALFSRFSADTDASVKSICNTAALSLEKTSIPNVAEFTAQIELSTANGKRFRALGALVGVCCIDSPEHLEAHYADLLKLASALEFYQASALIHDDVIDQASTRRGAPAFHCALANHHDKNEWIGNASHFGLSGAVLAGNYAIALAERCISEIQGVSHIMARYSQMATEVAVGQYLDLKASHLPLSDGDQLATTLEVVRLKSARYSVTHPIALGALLAGSEADRADELGAALEPAGIAFQMRDDYLGAFGEPTATGKPVGGDITERKRTVLLAMAYREAPQKQRVQLDSFYNSNATPVQADVTIIQSILEQYGAPALESFIEKLREDAMSKLRQVGLDAAAMPIVHKYVDNLVKRNA